MQYSPEHIPIDSMAKYWCVVKHFLHYEDVIENKLKSETSITTADDKELRKRLAKYKNYRMSAMDFLLGRNKLNNSMNVISPKDVKAVEDYLLKNLYTSASNISSVKQTDNDYKRKIVMKEEMVKYGTYGMAHATKRVVQDFTDGRAPVASIPMSDLVGFGVGLAATIGSLYAERVIGENGAVAMAVAGTGLFTDALYDKLNIGSYVRPAMVTTATPAMTAMRVAPRLMRNNNGVTY